MKRIYNFLNLFCLFSLISFFHSCVEPVTVKIHPEDLIPMLVVNGKVTDQPGPFKVNLSQSSPVYDYTTTQSFYPVADAKVRISDDKGNDFVLNPTKEGWYETDDKNLKGVPGNTYVLHITDAAGTEYESSPQLMNETSSIDSVYFEEQQRTRIEDQQVYPEDWLTIYLGTHTDVRGIQYFKWEFEETWEFNMPEYILAYKYVYLEVCHCTVDTPYMRIVYIPMKKKHCWVTEPSGSILVKSTVDNAKGEIERFPVFSIGPNDDRLSIRYSILVKQYTLNRELYAYFNRLKDLNETNGGLYEIMPAPLYGNVTSLSGNIKTLGYFFASAMSTKRIFINDGDTHMVTGHNAYESCNSGFWYTDSYKDSTVATFYGIIMPPNHDEGDYIYAGTPYCADCRVRGTNVKPDFW